MMLESRVIRGMQERESWSFIWGSRLYGVVRDGGPGQWASLEVEGPSTIWVWSGLLSVRVNWVGGWAEMGNRAKAASRI